ncbi:MAG: hypothetical protein CL904_04385 [Dehalococcoidia bacterium]|nr:hypothetical protein [Dehalococcoidia bacterium]|tara:strand:- start:14453 stop:15070 length:618 start_codon:yes stop_codon:yes gene_type:complete
MISAILTSAGESSRMGTPKPLLKWPDSVLKRDVTLIEYQVSQLSASSVNQIIVVLGHEADKIISYISDDKVDCVVNNDYKKGKSGSIKTGMKLVNHDSEAILLLAIDQPRSTSLINKVIDSHSWNQPQITSPTYRGKGGHPIIFSSDLKSELLSITEEKKGIRDVIMRNEKNVKRIPIDSDEISLDLNTPNEYNIAYRQRWKNLY